MTRFESAYKRSLCLALVLAALLEGGGSGRVFAAALGPGVTAAPGTLVGAATEPTVISSSPANGATNVPTSTHTSDNFVSGAAVTATFSQPMDPETVSSSAARNVLTFTVTEANGNNIPGSVVMNDANTVATFTPTSSALTDMGGGATFFDNLVDVRPLDRTPEPVKSP